MWYICDFFVRNKEAVSNQMELLAMHNKGRILGATRFMGQRALRRHETKDRIFVLPALLYNVALPLIAFTSRQPIHYFEEEPSRFKRRLFNARRQPLYISMYRRPSAEYAKHISQYRHLRKIFVEMQEHKDILVQYGIASDKVVVSPTPAKITRTKSAKKYNPDDLTIVFASWNNAEGDALHDRGLLYLLDILSNNDHVSLEIPLRDNKTSEFLAEARKRGVASRVSLLEITAPEQLVDMYDRADMVAFAAQARVTKDVPNSLLDGLMRAKPVLVSTMIDFHKIVQAHDLGLVIAHGTPAGVLHLDRKTYARLSSNAFSYAKRHTADAYLALTKHYEANS